MAEGGQDICQRCYFRRDLRHHDSLCEYVADISSIVDGSKRVSFAELLRQAEETRILSQNRDTDTLRSINERVRECYNYFIALRLRTPLTDAQINRIPFVQLTEEQKNQECAICFEEFEIYDRVKLLTCGHFYHVHCIVKWLKTKSGTCPNCRAILNDNFEIEDLIDPCTIAMAILNRCSIQIYHAMVTNARAQNNFRPPN